MGMSAKSRRQLTQLAEQLMEPGEHTVHLMRAHAGRTPVKKNLGAAAASLAVGVAVGAAVAAVGGGGGGGMVMGMYFVKSDVYIAVTDRRVLIFGGAGKRPPGPGRLWANVPRNAVTVISEKDKFLNHKLLLGIPGAGEPLEVTLAPINPGIRNDGRRLAQLLRQSSPAADLR
jgi:hypothetical protein